MERLPTINEEAGLGPEWVPVDTNPIVPGHTGAPPSPNSIGNYIVGSISPSLQHDADFVETAYGTPRVPIYPLMPISTSGSPSANSAIQNVVNNSSSTIITGAPGGPSTSVQINESGSFYGDFGFTYNRGTQSVSIVGEAIIGDGADISSPGSVLSAGNSGLVAEHGVGVANANLAAVAPGFSVLHYIEAADQNTVPLVLGNAKPGSNSAGVVWAIFDTGIDAGNVTETYYNGGVVIGELTADANSSPATFRVGANVATGGILYLTDNVQIAVRSEAGGGNLGFFQTVPVHGPLSITGDRQGNTAIADLLAQLGAGGYGLIVDNTINSGSASGFDFLLMGG